MSTELKDLLEVGAPEPSGVVDMEALLRRGRRLRRQRVTAVVAVIVVTGMIAAGSVRLLSTQDGPPTIVGSVLTDELAADLDRALADAAAGHSLPGAAAAVVFSDGSTWLGAVGVRGDADASPVTADTAFLMEHLTEVVTASVVVALVDEGVLALDDRVDRWLDGLSTDATIADLLRHRSGFADIVDDSVLGADWRADPDRRWTADDVLAAVPPAAPPGGPVRYPDTDYVALGRIAEIATGLDFAELVATRVTGPLGIDGIVVQATDELPPDVALPTDTGLTASTALLPFPAWATGNLATTGLVATPADAARLLHAILTSPAAQPWRDVLLDWGDAGEARPPEGAAGIVQGRHDGWREVWRADTAGTPGYRSALLHVPDARATIVVMTNRGYEAEQRGFRGEGPGLMDAVAQPVLDATRGTLLPPHVSDIWVADASGGGAAAVTDWPGTTFPLAWSPDGRTILAQSDRDGDADLWLVPVAGGPGVQLTDEPGRETFADFSPDGRSVVLTGNGAGDADLWVVDVDGRGLRRLVAQADVDEWLPDWSPDGSLVVFTRTPDDDLLAGELWTVRPDGSDLRRLPIDVASPVMARWSPAGGRLLVTTADGLLYVVGADGSGLRAIDAGGLVWHAAWAPDGSNILVAIGGTLRGDGVLGMTAGTSRDLWLLALEGGGRTLVAGGATDDLLPQWSPDGASIAWARIGPRT